VAEAIGLSAKMNTADVVVTGEGSLDRQTLEGKAPAGVARLARKLGKRVFAIVGRTDDDRKVKQLFDAVYALAVPDLSEEENIKRSPELLREGARRLGRKL
jgi:glycerate kinase